MSVSQMFFDEKALSHHKGIPVKVRRKELNKFLPEKRSFGQMLFEPKTWRHLRQHLGHSFHSFLPLDKGLPCVLKILIEFWNLRSLFFFNLYNFFMFL